MKRLSKRARTFITHPHMRHIVRQHMIQRLLPAPITELLFPRPKTHSWRVPLVFAAGLASGVAVWRLVRRWNLGAAEHRVLLDTQAPTIQTIDPRALSGERAIQTIDDGTGNVFHRHYYVDILQPKLTPEALIQTIVQDINAFVPTELAHFDKVVGDAETLAIGDEYDITITGPWNGPVRVSKVSPTSFTFITLVGHLEAGEIRFSVLPMPTDASGLRFEIRSRSRSKDAVVDMAYSTVGVAKTAQTSMWTYFCQQVVVQSDGTADGDVRITTYEAPYVAPSDTAAWRQYQAQLQRLGTSKLNFDLDKREDYTVGNGWRVDDYAVELPAEAPGAPLPNGSFALARNILLNYEFPDPNLIQGIFVPDDPIDERVMILRAHFLIFTFVFGARIGDFVDETRTDAKGTAQVWGYSYRTLEGHFEMGEITFTLWKYADSGKIEFRIHAYSRTGTIQNPFYRLGFALFGRRLQVYFAQSSLERMQQLVIQRLSGQVSEPIATPQVAPVATEPAAQDAMAEIVTKTP